MKPQVSQVAGRSVADYTATSQAPAPRLIPLEVVFRFSCPSGSSLLERVARDPGYLASLGYGDLSGDSRREMGISRAGALHEARVHGSAAPISEALAISGLPAALLQELLFKTAWVAGWVKSVCTRAGLELADGKLEWARRDEHGQLILVDAIGPDELRISRKTAFSSPKNFLRAHYRKTPWYEAVNKAKQEAECAGSAEWKKWVAEGPQTLTASMKELASQLYRALANELTGRNWFPRERGPLSKVIGELHAASGGR